MRTVLSLMGNSHSSHCVCCCVSGKNLYVPRVCFFFSCCKANLRVKKRFGEGEDFLYGMDYTLCCSAEYTNFFYHFSWMEKTFCVPVHCYFRGEIYAHSQANTLTDFDRQTHKVYIVGLA